MSSKILSDGKILHSIDWNKAKNETEAKDKTHTIKDITYIQFWTTLKTKNWIILTSIKTRCPIAMVKHSKKVKLNIMHMTVNFLGLFFRTGKIFFGLTRSSCLSVRMTDNFSASFGKSERLCWIRKSKKDRQHNGQKKQDKQRSTKHYTSN